MRLLYLCHRVPYPPNKGEKIRAFHELRALATRYEVDLFTLADNPADCAHEAELAKICNQVSIARLAPRRARLRALPYLLTKTPLTLPCFNSADLQRQVNHALARRSYDRIFVYSSAMAQYIEAAAGVPVLTDLVDVDSDKWRQYASRSGFPYSAVYRREWQCLREHERRLCNRSARVFVTTEREAQLARELTDGHRVHVILMGVDAEYFQPEASPSSSSAPCIVFTGEMSYYPNEEAVQFFAGEVLPLIRRSIPEARFLIVGRNPTKKVQALALLPGVKVTGAVADVRPYLRQAQVSVAPFAVASGVQSKILEALAAGLPTVATARALQGLTKDVAAVIETAESAPEFADAVSRLLQDRQAARRQGLEGRRRVMATYNWDRNLEPLLRFVDDPLGGASGLACVASRTS